MIWLVATCPTPLLAVQMYVPPLCRSMFSMVYTDDVYWASPVWNKRTRNQKHKFETIHQSITALHRARPLPSNLPFSSTLFFRVHVMFGIGLPVAEHSNRTGDPFRTCR